FKVLSLIKDDIDLVILATPVRTIEKLSPLIKKYIPQDCIVMDVGSTKKEVVDCLDRIFTNYIGAHPLAGLEKSGVRYAQADLFKGSICILTPTSKTSRSVLNRIKEFWKNLNAEVILMSPSLHDRILSFTSHLPHLISFCLLNSIPKSYLKISGPGLKDTLRIAFSSAEIWEQIFTSNSKNLISALKVFKDNLSYLEKALIDKDKKIILKFLKKANKKRFL
ncbi:MAG: prephenate dehydrogenase/arogenate dehydrogenase family protein, partial [Candidatus Omnitrophica bacterium]|nr:prephenate dehydrogenase/arogenate dehydrogenase family protein [Candidatus Omnitrophota bacterium]